MRVLLIAFDGLDKELIEKFRCENLQQEEFGEIDNDSGICSRKTSELFASLITGKTHIDHGVTGLELWRNPNQITKLENKLQGNRFFDKFRGLRWALYHSVSRFNFRRDWPTKEDLASKSIFEKVENSKPLFIPSYNPSLYFRARLPFRPLTLGFSAQNTLDFYDTREYEHRKSKVLAPVNKLYDLFMAHFHRPDLHQHMYGQEGVNFDERRLEELYEETDELAGKIVNYFEDDFDVIIFLSDHGLPKGLEHNKNAFYSCNAEMFESTPHITDFHDKILELVDK